MAQKFKGNVRVDGDLQLPSVAADRALITDGSNNIVESPTTAAEIAQLSGQDIPALQQQADDLNTLSGVAKNAIDLGTFTGAIIPDASTIKSALQALETSIEGLPTPMQFQGAWDASTNSPSLSSGVGTNGYVYVVSVGGTQDLGQGSIAYAPGDLVIYNGTLAIWQKVDGNDAVVSVNGQTGAVQLDAADIPYDNTTSGLSATDVQGAIDELDATLDTAVQADGSVSMTADLNLNSHKLINVTDPTNPQDAATKNYVDSVVNAVPGDIPVTSFSAANNQAAPTDVTGLTFSNAVTRSFTAQVAVVLDATTDAEEYFTLQGIQKAASWDLEVASISDDSGVVFSITSAGQIQYTSLNSAGFVSLEMKFRASTIPL